MKLLSPQQLYDLTHRKVKSKQCEELNRLGIEYKTRYDGFPLVEQDHVRQVLGVKLEGIEKKHKRIEPNWEAMRA